jgi:predicted Zn finger-like uncharacterized protein
MLIVCPQCTASYQVSPTSLGMDGRSVRCAKCQTIWFAAPVESMADTMAEPSFAHGPADPAPPDTYSETSDYPDPMADIAGDFAANAADRAQPAPGENVPFGPADDLTAVDVTPIPGGNDGGMMDDAPSIVPPIEDASAGLRYAAPLPGEDIESLAARREAKQTRYQAWRKFFARLPSLPALIVLLGAIILVLIAARNQIVKYAPQTASFYAMLGMPVNLRGLDFENIRVTRDVQDGIPVLVVEGKIVSSGNDVSDVPRLRFAVHDDSGREIYTWTMMPSRTLLAAGETLPFRSRLASPPAEGRNVSIRFFNRRDAISGFR